MGCIQRNEKLVFRRKLDLALNSFATKAIGFCEHAAHVVVKFTTFFAARESNDRYTCEWMNSMKYRVSLLAKHWTYQTQDKCINAAFVILPI